MGDEGHNFFFMQPIVNTLHPLLNENISKWLDRTRMNLIEANYKRRCSRLEERQRTLKAAAKGQSSWKRGLT